MLLIFVCDYLVLWLRDTWAHILSISHAFSIASLRKRSVRIRRHPCRKNSFLAWWKFTRKKIYGGSTTASPRWILCLTTQGKSLNWFTQPSHFHNPRMFLRMMIALCSLLGHPNRVCLFHQTPDTIRLLYQFQTPTHQNIQKVKKSRREVMVEGKTRTVV